MAGFIREHIVKRIKRSSKWNKTRKAHIKKHKYCEICGKKKDIQVHHVVPFHVNPELELEPTNLISLCGRHHLTFAHIGYWKSWNENIREDCKLWKIKFEERPI